MNIPLISRPFSHRFSQLSITFLASIYARVFIENGSQNDANIDAKIIKNQFLAAKALANVDLEYFLAAFGKTHFFNDC